MNSLYRLISLIRDKAVTYGDFILASGERSSYYLDLKQLTLDSEALTLIAELILDRLSQFAGGRPIVAVGGLVIGADPLVGAVLVVARAKDKFPTKGFLVRKEDKGHGMERFLEGPVRPGDTAIILEDVLTTGSSALLAAQRATEFGLRVEGVLAVVDRMQGGANAVKNSKLPCLSLLTRDDLFLETHAPDKAPSPT